MTGFASLLGYKTGGNPLLDWIDQNRSTLLGLGAGFAGGGPDLGRAIGAGLEGAGQGETADYNRKLQQNALDLQAQQRKATADWARANGYGQYADAIEAGAISGSDIFNLLNKQTVVPNGSSVIDGRGNTVSSPGPGFAGNDIKSQAWNTVMAANSPGADPALKRDPKYQAAWSIVTTPTMTPQGMMQPNIPASWGPNVQGAPPQQIPPAAGPMPSPAPGAPQGSDVAPLGSMSSAPQGFSMINPAPAPVRGPGIIPGTAPFDESQARVGFLSNSSVPDIKRVIDGFPALMSTKDQVLQGVSKFDPTGLTRAAQSPAYKQASDAMRAAMGNVLYFASGANLNAGELQRKIDAYVPAIGDDPQTAVNKLDRFANDVLSMAQSTKDPQTVQWAQQALADIQQTEQQLLSGAAAKPAAQKSAPKPGTIEDGYMFKGGDPADQNNWAPAT